VGGWQGLTTRLTEVAVQRGFAPGALTESWRHMGSPSANPMGVEWFGLVMGLGFVLSFGYWCTDFLVVQRAMAADSMNAARRTPLIAAFPKMVFPFLVILPGMIAISGTSRPEVLPAHLQCLQAQSGGAASQDVWQGIVPPKIDERTCEPVRGTDGKVAGDYDLATPMMLMHYFPSGILGVGLCALMASFMSGMAGNTTAFNTVWTYDIYQSYINRHASDAHYLAMGRAATVFGILISVAAAYVAKGFNNIMDLLQLVFAFVNAPLFATFMLGMFWKRATGHGAFTGLLAGTIAAPVGFKGGFLGSVLHTYPSEMAQNFWTAIFAWTTCFVITALVSLFTRPRPDEELKGLVYSLTPRPREEGVPLYRQPGPLAIAVLAATLVLNVIFW
jgi:solute:Na+ symporter, SSS family